MKRIAAIALLGTMLAVAGVTEARKPSPGWTGPLGDGVVIDLSVPAVFVMASPGAAPVRMGHQQRSVREIHAVHPRTGKLHWKSDVAIKPMLVHNGRLLAIGAVDAALGVVVLSAKTGKVLARCPVPKGGSGSIPIFSGLGSNVGSSAFMADGKPVIVSSVNTFYAGGMAPTPEMQAAARSRTVRAYEVDLHTGCARTIDVPEPEWDFVSIDTRTPSHTFESALGDRIQLQSRVREGVQRLVVQRDRDDVVQPDVELAAGRAGYVHAIVSADRRHIGGLVQTTDEHRRIVYHWRIVDLATGRLTDLPGRQGRPGGFVATEESVFITRTGAVVQGIDAGGKTIWTEGVRSTAYMGPYPP